jgi:hypothetical protein
MRGEESMNNDPEELNRLNEQNLVPKILVLPKLWEAFKTGRITAPDFEEALSNAVVACGTLDAKPKVPNKALLWKQYALHIGLYKHYLDQIQKFSVFYYAITGAILSFYFSKPEVPLVRYALLLPLLMSLTFGVLFSFSAYILQITREDIAAITQKLELETFPEINVLAGFLVLSALLLFTVAGLLLWFFFPALIVYSVILVVIVCLFVWLLFR